MPANCLASNPGYGGGGKGPGGHSSPAGVFRTPARQRRYPPGPLFRARRDILLSETIPSAIPFRVT